MVSCMLLTAILALNAEKALMLMITAVAFAVKTIRENMELLLKYLIYKIKII